MSLIDTCTIEGSLNQDFHIRPKQVTFVDHTVRFETSDDIFEIPYLGATTGWGEKRTAAWDLSEIAAALKVPPRIAGGAINTTRQVAGMPAARRPAKIRLVSTTRPWPQLLNEISGWGAHYIQIGDDSPSTSLIINKPEGSAERMVFTSPSESQPLALDPGEILQQLPEGKIGLLATNSPKSAELATSMAEAATAEGSPHYIELTRSLPASLRLDLMVEARLSAGNPAEFAEVLKPLGIACPEDEAHSSLEEFARVVSQAARYTQGDVVLHLGARGCIGHDSHTGLLFHLGVHYSKREKVQFALRAHPNRVNGRGDRFFGSLFTAHAAFTGDDRARSRLARAALQASIDVVATFSPHLHPAANWFAMRIFPDGFGA